MAKKYLLYIHNSDRFDKEEKKSELINALLDDLYIQEKVIKTPKDAMDKIQEKLNPGNKPLKFCQHGFAIGFCKFGCTK